MKRVLFRNRNFLMMVISNFISRIGTVIFNVALTWWIIEKNNSAKYIGVILASAVLPIAIFSLLAGVFCDNKNKKIIIISCDCISCCICLILSFMAYTNNMNNMLLIILNFMLGTCSCIFKPAYKSIIPEIIDKKIVVSANSIINSFSETSKIIGPAVCAAFLAIPIIGVKGAFLVDAISFAISALCESQLGYQFIKIKNEAKKKAFINELKDGLRYVSKNKILFNTFTYISVINFFLGVFDVLIPLYVLKILKLNSAFYSTILSLYSAGGVGVIISTLIFRQKKMTWKVLAVLGMLTGIPLIIIGCFTQKYIILISVLMLGFCSALFNVYLYSFIQTKTDNNYMGRTFSILYFLSFLIMPISSVIYGFLGDFILEAIFTICGFMIVCIGLFFLLRVEKCEQLGDQANAE